MRCTRLVALSTLVGIGCGGADEVVPELPPDATPIHVDAAFEASCPDGDATTVAGSTPRGNLDDLGYLNVRAVDGFCLPTVYLHLTAGPAWGNPDPTPHLTVSIDVREIGQDPLTGDFAAAVRHVDGGGEAETTGTFTADAIDPFDATDARVRGRLVVNEPDAGWSIDLTVDADYCRVDTCI